MKQLQKRMLILMTIHFAALLALLVTLLAMPYLFWWGSWAVVLLSLIFTISTLTLQRILKV